MNESKIKNIIKHYKKEIVKHPDKWLIDCKNSQTLLQAIKLASTARNYKGEKHGHQRRISPKIIDNFSSKIIDKVEEVKQSNSFDKLISTIENCRIKGIGELAIYDTALRIGNYLNLYPYKIYLHAGTRVGARKLIKGKIECDTISRHQLPSPFRTDELSDAEIEDILCIYKLMF